MNQEEINKKEDIVETRVNDMLDELSSSILDAGGLIPPNEIRFYEVEQLFRTMARNNIKAIFYAKKPFEINLRDKEKETQIEKKLERI